ncbi:hypothetical protein AXK57_10880 [Tsukamurella pulmonis]|nr:hypothetical protein AXK57_10880 [Tsukamurella pulmonis]RDH09254.1 hypothetical protein DVB88_24065 [Tsukamurella pulmonis]
MTVRMRFGPGLGVLAAVVVVLLLLAGVGLYHGVVGDPVSYLISAGSAGLATVVGVPLRRTLRARNRAPLRLTPEGLYLEPVTAMSPRFIVWGEVTEVVHAPRTARGFAYHHEWHVRTRSAAYPRLMVEYPPGFTPGPRRIRRRIRRLSPNTTVRTGMREFIGW